MTRFAAPHTHLTPAPSHNSEEREVPHEVRVDLGGYEQPNLTSPNGEEREVPHKLSGNIGWYAPTPREA